MWARLRRAREHGDGASALLDERPPGPPASVDELWAEIGSLSERNRARRDPRAEERLLWLRHLAGAALLDAAASEPAFPRAVAEGLSAAGGLPEISADRLTAELLRAGILRDGCLLVRGLVPKADALRFAERIERAYAERDRHDAGKRPAAGYYSEFQPDPRFGPVVGRTWIKQGGGLLAADSPLLSFEMFELFGAAGVAELASRYLGEPALISVHKTTLRRADPSVPGAWHQDGFFMGPVRSLNLWLSLSRCGDEAPGLDIVPRRLDYLVTTATEEAALDYTISQRKAEQAAGEVAIMRPIFEPGDALFFDELFLHQTGSDPSMPNRRYAIENWFFGGSAFPSEYAPLAV